jgi:hypothetical protein
MVRLTEVGRDAGELGGSSDFWTCIALGHFSDGGFRVHAESCDVPPTSMGWFHVVASVLRNRAIHNPACPGDIVFRGEVSALGVEEFVLERIHLHLVCSM